MSSNPDTTSIDTTATTNAADIPNTDNNTTTNTPVVDTTAVVQDTPVVQTTEPNAFGEFKLLVQDINAIIKDYIVIIVIAFLAMFLILRIMGGENTVLGAWVSSMIDIFVFVLLFAWIGYDFIFTYSGEQREARIKELWDSFKSYVNDGFSILYTSLFIVVFYTFVYVVGIPMESGYQSIFVGIIDKSAWLVLILSSINWITRTFFGISILDDLTKKMKVKKEEKEEDKKGEPEKPTTNEEVFNIGNNKYTYEDAQSICKSYGARLATYDEIETAYNKGAEWCSYGWSEGQMAYFPTQKATWAELQKDEKRKNDCGRPGVNGGYMANPYLRFGVNCYGKKPDPSASDLAKMQIRKEKIAPKTKEDVELEMKVKFWKENADTLLNVSAFNSNKWSQY